MHVRGCQLRSLKLIKRHADRRLLMSAGMQLLKLQEQTFDDPAGLQVGGW